MATPKNASAEPVPTTVIAFTNNPKDRGYYHCFEQKQDITLTLMVGTDPSVDSIYFVLWNLHDPANPTMAEPAMNVSVKNGVAKIEIKDIHFHLGPGPYCATLTTSSPAAGAADSRGGRKIFDNAIYYYDTWVGTRPYRWPV
jgi:hypothetical protein